jgi:hypothetical protein
MWKILLLLIVSSRSYADLLLVNDMQKAGENPFKIQSLLSEKGFRIQSDRDKTIFIFDAQKDTYYLVDEKNKTITQFDKKDLIQNRNRVLEARKKIKVDKVVDVPDVGGDDPKLGKKLIQDTFKKSGIGFNREKVEYRKTLLVEKVNGWQALRVDSFINNKKMSSMWLADGKDMKLTVKEMEWIKKLNQDISFFTKGMGQESSLDFEEFYLDTMDENHNVVVKSQILDENNKVEMTNLLTKIDKPKTSNLLVLPTNFNKKIFSFK